MTGRTPSLLALLGLAAVAGYQNRDALRSLVDRTLQGAAPDSLRDRAQDGADPWIAGQDPAALPRRAETGLRRTLMTGLADLMRRFDLRGDNTTAQSWVGAGQNLTVTPDWLATVLGDEVIEELSVKTGLARVTLLARLSQVLPETVDLLTPQGRLDSADDPALAEPLRRAI